MHSEAPKFIKIITLVLAAVFLFLCVLLVREYHHVQRVHEIDSYKTLISNMRHKKPLTVEDISIIQSWMTFSYLNTVFGIPHDYFKTTLSIADTHYPNIPIGRYAKNMRISSGVFVDTIKAQLALFLTTSTTQTH